MLRSVLFPGALSVECSAASGQASGGSPVATYAQRLRKARQQSLSEAPNLAARALAMALTLNITDTGRIHGANLFKNTVRGTMKPLTSQHRDYRCSGLYNSKYHSMRKYNRCGYFV